NYNITLSDTEITSVETLNLGGHHNYGLTVTGDIAGGSTLTFDAADANRLTLDLSAATSTSYAITAAGSLTTVTFGRNFSSTDTITGSAGNTTLNLNGDYASTITFSDTKLTNIGTLKLQGSHSYTVSVIGYIGEGNFTELFMTPGASDIDIIDL